MIPRRLSDAQVKTLIVILAFEPKAPSDLDRYPTLRMMLEHNIITMSEKRTLQFNSLGPENAYQYVVPVNFVEDCAGLLAFDDMEKADRLIFRQTAETTETDTFYYFDVMTLCAALAVLGAECDIHGGRIVFPEGTAAADMLQGEQLIEAFHAKYPATETSCPGNCEPSCDWCNRQADIAATYRD